MIEEEGVGLTHKNNKLQRQKESKEEEPNSISMSWNDKL